jgi:hypothetical protein
METLATTTTKAGKTIWHLQIKEPETHSYYSSFRALFNDNKDYLGKSRSFFEKIKFDTPFTNENYTIRKSEMHTTGQVKTKHK